MGQGVNFFGSNKVFGPPPGASDVVPLHTFINGEHIVSCWRLSHSELAEANESGCVYLSIKSATTLFPVFVGSESEVRRLVADDIVKGCVTWKRPPHAIPSPRLPVRFSVPDGAVGLATTVGGTIEIEVDGPTHVLCHVRTKREDAPELEATDLFAELEHSRHIIARLSSLVEGAALHLIDGKPLEAPELAGYLVDLAEATNRETLAVPAPADPV